MRMWWPYALEVFQSLWELFHIIDYFLAKQGICSWKIVYSQEIHTRKFTIGNDMGSGETEACLYLVESASCIMPLFIKFHKYFSVSDEGGRRSYKVRRRWSAQAKDVGHHGPGLQNSKHESPISRQWKPWGNEKAPPFTGYYAELPGNDIPGFLY